MGLVDKDKVDILTELKESNASELTKMRDDWDSLQHRVRELEGKLDVSKTLVRGIVSERDALRTSFEERQLMLQGEDEHTLAEMRRLLEEITADGATLSPAQLLNRFAEATEKSAENFAKRAEVSPLFHSSLYMSSNIPGDNTSRPTNCMGALCILPRLPKALLLRYWQQTLLFPQTISSGRG